MSGSVLKAANRAVPSDRSSCGGMPEFSFPPTAVTKSRAGRFRPTASKMRLKVGLSSWLAGHKRVICREGAENNRLSVLRSEPETLQYLITTYTHAAIYAHTQLQVVTPRDSKMNSLIHDLCYKSCLCERYVFLETSLDWCFIRFDHN